MKSAGSIHERQSLRQRRDPEAGSSLFPPPEDGGDICSSETTRVCDRDPGSMIDGRGDDRDGLELRIEFRDVRGDRE